MSDSVPDKTIPTTRLRIEFRTDVSAGHLVSIIGKFLDSVGFVKNVEIELNEYD